MSQSNYTQIIKHIEGLEAFTGNTMTGERRAFGFGTIYQVWSYNEPIALVVTNNRARRAVIFRNERKYSVTTSKHQTYTWRGLDELRDTLLCFAYEVDVVPRYDHAEIDRAILDVRNAVDFELGSVTA